MPNKLKERLKSTKEKLKKFAEKAKNFKPTLVISKLRDGGRTGARRTAWLILGILLYYFLEWSVLEIILLYILLVLFLFVFLPFLFKYTPWLQRNMVFLPYVKWPGVVDFNDPSGSCDLENTRNFYVDTEPERNIRVGVWHILPECYNDEADHDYDQLLAEDDKTVVLYLHGNSANRAGAHRVELYKVLRKLGVHVVCCDYRGYADSSPGMPNETGVVTDARAVYEWCVEAVNGDTSRIIVWGHSLGTGIGGHLVSLLSMSGQSPAGLVLESPFNNIYDEIRNHPMCWLWSKFPWFDFFFTKGLASNDVAFVTDQRIAVIFCPILILHAEDDVVVPFKLGKALHETAREVRSEEWGEVQFISFSSDKGYGHKYICRDPNLPHIVRNFIKTCGDYFE